jgi:hypothetical protein
VSAAASRTLLIAAVAAASFGAGPSRAASVTVRRVGESVVGASSVVAVSPGATVELEVALDTGGDTWEGCRYTVRLTGGAIDSLVLTHVESAAEPLTPDLFGPPVIDEEEAAIRNINTGLLESGPGREPGVYVIDRITFTAEAIPEGGIAVVPALEEGDTFAIGESIVSPALYGATVVVPEPTADAIAALAVVGLASRALRRSRSQPRITNSARQPRSTQMPFRS